MGNSDSRQPSHSQTKKVEEGEDSNAVEGYPVVAGMPTALPASIPAGGQISALLTSACEKGDLELVCSLLASGKVAVNGDICTQPCKTTPHPLYVAVSNGHREIVCQLLAYRADPNQVATEYGATALLAAAEKDFLEIAQLLLDAKASVDQSTLDYGTSPLCMAAVRGHPDIASLLLKRNAEVNRKQTTNGKTALHFAAEHGQNAVVRVLLDHGADVRMKTNMGKTAYDLAQGKNRIPVLDILDRFAASAATSCE